jgi:hypothetical protein
MPCPLEVCAGPSNYVPSDSCKLIIELIGTGVPAAGAVATT